MKRKYATTIITQVLQSMVDEERITDEQENMLYRVMSDIFYDGKVLQKTLDTYKEYIEQPTQK